MIIPSMVGILYQRLLLLKLDKQIGGTIYRPILAANEDCHMEGVVCPVGGCGCKIGGDLAKFRHFGKSLQVFGKSY